MTPRVLEPAGLQSLVGQEIGASRWITIEQPRIQAFADATMDQQWIHVDVTRAARECGGPIAHGFLTLSLLSVLVGEIWQVRGARSVVNYGFDRLRFITPVPAGARIRLIETLKKVEERKGALLLTRESVVEVQNQAKPAVIAEWLALVHLRSPACFRKGTPA